MATVALEITEQSSRKDLPAWGRAMSDHVIAAAGTDKPTGVRWKIFFLLLFLVSVNYIDRASLSDRKSTRLNSSHLARSRMPSSA